MFDAMLKDTCRVKRLMATAAMLVTAGAFSPAHAQQAPKEWDVSVGAGAMLKPIYEGSEDYTVMPLPYVSITYMDMVTLDYRGLQAKLFDRDGWKSGIALVWHGGRDEDGGSLLSFAEDDTLQGMGDIDAALGAQVFASYTGPNEVTLASSITQYVGEDNDGLLVDASLKRKLTMSRQLYITPSVGTTWANGNYTDTFFGVTPVQAARSQFNTYDADAGFKDIHAGVGALYFISPQWFVSSSASLKYLLQDAADSPISEDDTSLALTTTLGYRF